MRILLDTNVLPLQGSLDALELTTLFALAHEHGAQLVLPWVVVEEAEARRLEKAQAAFQQLRRATLAAQQFASLEPLSVPDPSLAAADFRAELERRFEVASLPSGAADEALRREAFRAPPAQKKGGARDAAIWLTVKSELLASSGELSFLTRNHADFGDPADRLALHPELAQELAEHMRRFRYFCSTGDLVAALASRVDRDIDSGVISRSLLVQSTIKEAVLGVLTTADSSAVYEDSGPAMLLEIQDSRCFRVKSHVLAILSTIWEVTGLITDSTAMPPSVEMGFRATAPAQLWLRFGVDGPSEPLSAELHSVGEATVDHLIGDYTVRGVIKGPRPEQHQP